MDESSICNPAIVLTCRSNKVRLEKIRHGTMSDCPPGKSSKYTSIDVNAIVVVAVVIAHFLYLPEHFCWLIFLQVHRAFVCVYACVFVCVCVCV